MSETEIWKVIPNCDKYQASNWGRIRNTRRKKPYTHKLNTYEKSPYYKVTLYDNNGVSASCRVHQIVYETFIGPVPEGLVIDHINGIKTDNRLENLRAVTNAENCNNPATKDNYRNRKHSPEEYRRRSEGQKRRFQRPDQLEFIRRIGKKAREARKQNRELRSNGLA